MNVKMYKDEYDLFLMKELGSKTTDDFVLGVILKLSRFTSMDLAVGIAVVQHVAVSADLLCFLHIIDESLM